MLTAVRRLCGQPSTRPIGVVDQSRVCISDPISPAPASAMGRGSYLGERSAIEPLGMRRRAGKQPMGGHLLAAGAARPGNARRKSAHPIGENT